MFGYRRKSEDRVGQRRNLFTPPARKVGTGLRDRATPDIVGSEIKKDFS